MKGSAVFLVLLTGCSVNSWNILAAIKFCGKAENIHHVTATGMVQCVDGTRLDLTLQEGK